jgi:type IV pilus assembly protein PilN
MPRINLLPWRETLKKERELRFSIIMGASLAFTGLVVLSVHMYMQGLINYQAARNNFLKDQIKQAEAKIKEIEELDQKKQALIDRMEVIQKLEESRPQVVHLFDEMVKRLPNGVFFKKMEQDGKKNNLGRRCTIRCSCLFSND